MTNQEASMMGDLIAFMAARLDEEEAAARACADNDGNLGWRDSPVAASLGDHTIRTTGSRPVARIRETDSRGDETVPRILSPDAVAAYIARHDPARTLREVAAGRAVIRRYELAAAAAARGSVSSFVHGQDDGYAGACLDAIRDAVAVWDGHPDYDPAWRMDS